MSSARPGFPETAFEKQRGIGLVEVRGGYAQVHVSRLAEPIHDHRLDVLKVVAEAGTSVDFLKLTPSGLSFLVSESEVNETRKALEPLQVHYTIREDRCVVLVHAVNMRDEEGLTAKIVQKAIESGALVDYISDMHDRMMIVAESKYAQLLSDLFKEEQIHGR